MESREPAGLEDRSRHDRFSRPDPTTIPQSTLDECIGLLTRQSVPILKCVWKSVLSGADLALSSPGRYGVQLELQISFAAPAHHGSHSGTRAAQSIEATHSAVPPEGPPASHASPEYN
jgi:hypothetical protein